MVKINRQAKLLNHYDSLQGILEGKFKAPIMVDIDPVNGGCNLNCEWCSQSQMRKKERIVMSKEMMQNLGKFSKEWGIKSWRISGDSEPLINSDIDVLIQSGYDQGLDIGLITNGILLNKPKKLALLNYLGISLDATDKHNWSKFKSSSPELFDRIIANVKKVREDNPKLDISLKFVDWKNQLNHEKAKELAESLGCNCIIRKPIETPEFDCCLVTPLGGVFKADGSFDICCDARGRFVLAKDWKELLEVWGTEKHKNIINSIDPKSCGGCAKIELNFILQNVVQKGPETDKCNLNFI